MLTIKHVEKDGRESVFEAVDIHRASTGELAFGQEKVVTSGKVYVMNDAGRTVAVYDFDKKEQTP
jgi:nucleoside-triphosphatase THEP1